LDKVLYYKLKQYRYNKSLDKGVAAYCIMTNYVLDMITRSKPQSNGELLVIKGVGKGFIEKYGDEVL